MSQKEDAAVMLYVGCGNHRLPGFTHVEINVSKQFKKGGDVGAPDILCDITKHIPLRDDSVTMVFSRATMEHLEYQELTNHLLVCRRVLKKGGVVRMIVPDFDIMIQNYQDRTEDLEKADRESDFNDSMPRETYSEVFNQRALYFDHRYLHNFETLSKALERTGFSSIKKMQEGDSRISYVNAVLLSAEEGRTNHEIIVEAVKEERSPSVVFKSLQEDTSRINRFLGWFNLLLTKKNRNLPRFPTRGWFLLKKLTKRKPIVHNFLEKNSHQ